MIYISKKRGRSIFMDIEGIEPGESAAINLFAPKDTPLTESEKDLLGRVKTAAQSSIKNLGCGAAMLGKNVEALMRQKINKDIREAGDLRKTIDLLVNLSGKLSFS